MTFSETQIDKFCQSAFVAITPSNRQSDAATPILGTLAVAFLASASARSFPMPWELVVQVRFTSGRAFPGCGEFWGRASKSAFSGAVKAVRFRSHL
jgi:hypothetical protein